MRFAYADPPYLGCGRRLYGQGAPSKHGRKGCVRIGSADHTHPDAAIYDDPATHRALIDRLVAEFPDGWALSCGSRDLRMFLPWCPEDVRVGAWTKTWTALVIPVKYAWEPVIFRGGRAGKFGQVRTRDWLVSPPAMGGFPGAKPEEFAFWVFDLFGAEHGDELVDLFPGSGAVSAAWPVYLGMQRAWQRAAPREEPQLPFVSAGGGA